MNKDLQATLDELGPEYHRLVREMRAPFEPERAGARRIPVWKIGYLAAALLLVVLGLVAIFCPVHTASRPAPHIYTIAYADTPDSLQAIVAAQRADGSWENDFLTRQNAAALQNDTDPKARIAYLRAVRYLRKKGLAPFSVQEFNAYRAASNLPPTTMVQ